MRDPVALGRRDSVLEKALHMRGRTRRVARNDEATVGRQQALAGLGLDRAPDLMRAPGQQRVLLVLADRDARDAGVAMR